MGENISQKTITLQLCQIRIHPTYQDLVRSISISYLCNQTQRICPEGVFILLATHPILVAKKKDIYFLISGKRSFDIAITILPANTTIKCNEIQTEDKDTVKKIILTDTFITKCFYSVNKTKDIGDIFLSMSNFNLIDVLKRIMFIKNKDDLAKLLAKSYNTIFPKKPSGD